MGGRKRGRDDDDNDEADGGTRGLTMTTQMHQPH